VSPRAGRSERRREGEVDAGQNSGCRRYGLGGRPGTGGISHGGNRDDGHGASEDVPRSREGHGGDPGKTTQEPEERQIEAA